MKNLTHSLEKLITTPIFAILGLASGYLIWRKINIQSFVPIFIGLVTFIIGILLPTVIIEKIKRHSIHYSVIFFLSLIFASITSLKILPPEKEGICKYLSKGLNVLLINTESLSDSIDLSTTYIELLGENQERQLILLDVIELKFYEPVFPYFFKMSDRELCQTLNLLQLRLYQRRFNDSSSARLISSRTIWFTEKTKSRNIEILENGIQVNF